MVRTKVEEVKLVALSTLSPLDASGHKERRNEWAAPLPFQFVSIPETTLPTYYYLRYIHTYVGNTEG